MVKAMRYANVEKEIVRTRARHLLEVGTWNGERAIAMIRAAFVGSPGGPVTYRGFDLFEAMTPGKAAEELNVKKPFTRAEVDTRIVRWGNDNRKDFFFVLFEGDTRVTLKRIDRITPPIDFAWIDGGHSVETITSDWSNIHRLVRPGGVIMLDDYYSGVSDEFTKKFGCNSLVGALLAEDIPVTIFPEKDPLQGGGFVQCVRIQR